MKFRALAQSIAAAAALTLTSGLAMADDASDAQSFVQKEHDQIVGALRSNASATQIYGMLDQFVDYGELTRRAFGHPCPTSDPCTDIWSKLTPEQQKEVSGKLKQLVQHNYKKSLLNTVDYDLTFKNAHKQEDAVKVRTEAKSKAKPRDPAVQVDYLVRCAGGKCQVIGMTTEGSDLALNYNKQFTKMWNTPGQGYPHIIERLDAKIAKAKD